MASASLTALHLRRLQPGRVYMDGGDLLDRRRVLMEQWADYCLPREQAGVVPLRRGRPG